MVKLQFEGSVGDLRSMVGVDESKELGYQQGHQNGRQDEKRNHPIQPMQPVRSESLAFLVRAMAKNNKIEAIKGVRELLGLGLAEAKSFVEENGPPAFREF